MRSVDILIGGRSGLTAIMMSTAEEVRRPHLLQSRFTLNKLALPSETKFIYVASEAEQPPATNLVFSAILSITERSLTKDVASLAADPHRNPRRDEAIKFQRLAESRFADTYRLARILQRPRVRPEADLRMEVTRRSHRSQRDILPGGIEGAFFDARPTSAAVVNLSADGVARWFDLSHGEPEPTNKPAGAAFAIDYPRIPGDPEKVLRASAFAGWVLTTFDTGRPPEEVAALVDRYARLR